MPRLALPKITKPAPRHYVGAVAALTVWLLVALAVGGWFGWSLKGQWAVDACLDAGGRWERHGSYCAGAPAARDVRDS